MIGRGAAYRFMRDDAAKRCWRSPAARALEFARFLQSRLMFGLHASRRHQAAIILSQFRHLVDAASKPSLSLDQ
jgi:hypothetical protein